MTSCRWCSGALACLVAGCSSSGSSLETIDSSFDSGDSSLPGGDAGSDGNSPDTSLSDVDTVDSPANDGVGDSGIDATPTPDHSVLEHHLHPSRDGLYIEPAFTKVAAATMHLDPTFHAPVVGAVYAQPLYVEKGPGGRGVFLIVTEANNVYAFDEANGDVVWQRNVGTPADSTGVGCGLIAPLGITGTPYIDLPGRTMFFDAVVGTGTAGNNIIRTHEVHAVSVDDGTERPGWPVDASTFVHDAVTFDPKSQNQRGALAVVAGTLYVPYGGHSGDCGNERGWVVGIPLATPGATRAWALPTLGGGIWGPSGIATDGTSLFASTGNAISASTWGGGEAVLRLGLGPTFSGLPPDFFTPSNWKSLDDADLDLGGSGPLLIDVPGATPSKLVVALGKNGVAYLLDRANLGGIGVGDGGTGEGVASMAVAAGALVNCPSAFSSDSGHFVIVHVANLGLGVGCPGGAIGDLLGLKISEGSPPQFQLAWCAVNRGQGSTIVTTTDGRSEPIVWSVGAESSNQLHAFDGETGKVLFDGGPTTDQMTQVRRYTVPVVVKGRLFVGADAQLYAFRPSGP